MAGSDQLVVILIHSKHVCLNSLSNIQFGFVHLQPAIRCLDASPFQELKNIANKWWKLFSIRSLAEFSAILAIYSTSLANES